MKVALFFGLQLSVFIQHFSTINEVQNARQIEFAFANRKFPSSSLILNIYCDINHTIKLSAYPNRLGGKVVRIGRDLDSAVGLN